MRVASREAFLTDLVLLTAEASHGVPMVTWAGWRRTIRRWNLGGRRQIEEREKKKEKEKKGRF